MILIKTLIVQFCVAIMVLWFGKIIAWLDKWICKKKGITS